MKIVPKVVTISHILIRALERIEELESVLTELQVFLNAEGILPDVHFFGEESENEK